MKQVAEKMISFYYAIKFQFAFLVKKIRMRPFMKQNKDFALMFSSEADIRLNQYINSTDIRIKKLAAAMMLKSYLDTFKITNDEKLSIVELNYISSLIPQIKKDLKII